VADAPGLALFALSGARLAERAQCPPLIVVLMRTVTGVTGGMLRDVITAQVPLVLRREVYATAAIAGVVLYLALQALGVPSAPAFAAGAVTVVALRLLAIRLGLHLPGFGRSSTRRRRRCRNPKKREPRSRPTRRSRRYSRGDAGSMPCISSTWASVSGCSRRSRSRPTRQPPP
jgi:hypothetical protein